MPPKKELRHSPAHAIIIFKNMVKNLAESKEEETP